MRSCAATASRSAASAASRSTAARPAWAAIPVPGKACTFRKRGFRTSSRARPCAKRWTSGPPKWRNPDPYNSSRPRSPMKYLTWLLKAAIFFTLFAFALNNQQDATVHFFFGTQWRAPMVLVVLAAFAIGLAVGALGMVPRWWKHRVAARRARQAADASAAEVVPATPAAPHGL